MMLLTHLAGGLSGTLYALAVGEVGLSGPAVAAGLIATCVPDLDHPNSALGRQWPGVARRLSGWGGSHRGPLHVPWLGIVLVPPAVGLLVGVVAWLVEAGPWSRVLEEALLGALVGYLTHLVFDSLTPEGVPLSLRGRRDLVLDEERELPATGSRADRRLGAVLFVLSLSLFPAADQGALRLVHLYVQQSLASAVRDYERLAPEFALYVEGEFLEPVSTSHAVCRGARCEVVGLRCEESGRLIVRTRDETGRRRLIEIAEAGGQWRPLRMRLWPGGRVVHVVQSEDLAGSSPRVLAALAEIPDATVSGRLLLEEEPRPLARGLRFLEPVRVEHRELALDYATWQDILDAGVADQAVRQGVVYLERRVPAGAAATAVALARRAGEGDVVVRRFAVGALGDLRVTAGMVVYPGRVLAVREEKAAEVERARRALAARAEDWRLERELLDRALAGLGEDAARTTARATEARGDLAVLEGALVKPETREKARKAAEQAEAERRRLAREQEEKRMERGRAAARAEADLAKLRLGIEEAERECEVRAEVGGVVTAVETGPSLAGYQVTVKIQRPAGEGAGGEAGGS